MLKYTPGERFIRTISFESVDRVPVMDFGYWKETIEKWHSQGLPDYITSTEDVESYFGCDRGFETNLINYYGDKGPMGIEWGIWPPFTKEIIEETDDTILYGGECGKILEHKTSGSMPHQMQFPVETMKDFEEKVLPRMDPWDKSRVLPDCADMLKRGKDQGQATGIWIDGYLAWPRILMGIVNLSYAYYDEPELIHAIQRNHTDFVKGFLDMVLLKTNVDYACFFEDMAFNSGSLVSEDIFHEFMTPYYLELIDYLRNKGVKKVLIDSDGNSIKLTDLFVEVGADGHYPCEITAGAFPEIIRERHPKLALIGGLDKRALETDRSSIDKELSKIPFLLSKGGYIPSLDHRVQPGVPMENYRYYVEKKREIIEKYSR